MKKAFLNVSVGFLALVGIFSLPVQNIARAQEVSPTVDVVQVKQLVQIFIAVGIISPDKVSAAEAAVNGLSSNNNETISATTALSSALTLSTDSATPLAATIAANSGANDNEADGVTTLVFDLTNNDTSTVAINSVAVNFATSGNGTAQATTAYLYVGAQEISSAPVTNGVATFQNLGYDVAANNTGFFTVKTDIKNANSSPVTITASVSAVGDVDSDNNPVEFSGSAAGNPLTVLNAAPIFTLASTPSIATSQTPVQNNNSTTTVTATFPINIQAVGDSFIFPTQASGQTFTFGIYQNGTAITPVGSTFTSWNIPSSGVITQGLAGNQAFTLQQNNSVQIPVSFIFNSGSVSGTGSYTVGLNSINYLTTDHIAQSATYMSGSTAWRTAAINLSGTGVQINPSITVTSPNGGTYQTGNSIPINWTSSNLGSSTISVNLVSVVNGADSGIIGAFPAIYNVNDGSVPNTGSVTWTVPAGFVGGTYKVRLNPDSNLASTVYSDSPVFSILQTITVQGKYLLDTSSPTISFITPASVMPGQPVNVYGANYDSNSVVTLNGTQITPAIVSPTGTSLTFITPNGIAVGSYPITVEETNSGLQSTAFNLNIYVPQQNQSSGGGGSSGGSQNTSTTSSGVALNPNADYYFHTSSGTISLNDIYNAGFNIDSAHIGNPSSMIMAMPNNPPAPTDSASAIYFRYDGNWYQTGNLSAPVDGDTQVSPYFIARVTSNGSAMSFNAPSNVVYDGTTAVNGTPRPWNQ